MRASAQRKARDQYWCEPEPNIEPANDDSRYVGVLQPVPAFDG